MLVSDPRLTDEIYHALCVGKAEEPEIETEFVVRSLASRHHVDRSEIEAILQALALGVSPYRVIGEYPLPGTTSTLLVPPEVMPPGSVTRAAIQAVQEAARRFEPALIADLGCGTGVLGIAALLAVSGARGMLIDIDPNAYRVAQTNLKRFNLDHRATAVCTDGLASVPASRIDLIVTNPPFVPTNAIATLAPRFGRFAPRRAIDGGHDGFELFHRLLPQMRSAISPNGCIVLQVDTGQKQNVIDFLGGGWAITSGWTTTHPNLIVAVRVTDTNS